MSEEVLAEVARRLGRAVVVEEPDGTRDELIAGAIHPEHGWVAWVVGREREPADAGGFVECGYWLRARMEGERLSVDWEVETYNPYFGCHPHHLAWYGEHVVFVYSEKHYPYAASVLGRAVQLLRLERGRGGWTLEDGVLTSAGVRYELPYLEP